MTLGSLELRIQSPTNTSVLTSLHPKHLACWVLLSLCKYWKAALTLYSVYSPELWLILYSLYSASKLSHQNSQILFSLNKAKLLYIKNPLVFRLLSLQRLSKASFGTQAKNMVFVLGIMIPSLEIWETESCLGSWEAMKWKYKDDHLLHWPE